LDFAGFGGCLRKDAVYTESWESWKGGGKTWAGAEKAEEQITRGSALIMSKSTW